MPAKYRLKRADFKDMRHFTRVSGKFLCIAYGDLPGRTFPGAACVVSAKVASRAVDRNTIKRRCRALLLEYMKNTGTTVIIVYAKKGAAQASFVDFKKEMTSLLSGVRRLA